MCLEANVRKQCQMTVVTFEIDGLNCASCVARAESAIKDVSGVQAVTVNLLTAQASVTFEEPANVSALRAALDKVGKPARLITHQITIQDMTCASCVGRVEAALETVSTVVSATVNLANGTAQIESLSADPSPAIQALKQIGYRASIATDTPQLPPETSPWRNMLIAAILTLPVFILEMGGHVFPAFHHAIARTIGMQASWVVQWILTTLVLIWPGQGFYQKGVPALLRGAPDMNSLVVLGASAAYVYSTIVLLAPSLLPEQSRAVYFEAAAVIVTLILLGRFLEARAKGQTGAAIRKLIALRPDTAKVERNGDIIDLPVDEIVLGDLLHLRPGERVAVDGAVVSGESWLDESMLTGEPLPASKSTGNPVSAGTINTTGAVVYQATAVGPDTTLARIIEMVQQAQSAKLPIQNVVNKITAWFVPAVLLIAAITVGVWLVFGPDPAASYALVAGVSVLIIACPCAMGLATPTSIMVGTGRAAQKGVLFRKGDALQALQGIKVVAFDKTGTLTEGRPQVVDILPNGATGESELLSLAASLNSQSEHPIAAALLAEAQARDLTLKKAKSFVSVTGRGVRGTVGRQTVLVGNLAMMSDHDIAVDDQMRAQVESLSAQGRTAILVAKKSGVLGVVSVADPIRETARDMIKDLHQKGLRTAMISGDAVSTAKSVAAQLGIDWVVGGVLPDGKVEAVSKLASGQKIAFVGDGINDAPALAAADVGIAIGTGTDVAIETADVVLVSSDLSSVADAFQISRATMRNIKQNLFWAFGYNVLLIPVAAGVLFPVFGVLLSPALAAAAMALSSIFVVSNALRLKRA